MSTIFAKGSKVLAAPLCAGVFSLNSRKNDLHHGVVHTFLDDGGVRTLRLTPVGAEDLAPPGCLGYTPCRREVVGQKPPENERPALTFGIGNVACSIDEGDKALVGDGDRIYPERL